MALEQINVGNFVNDGTGDDLRTAFLKINSNFEEISLQQGQNNTASNVGTGIGVFKEKVGVDLRLKTLVNGDGIYLTTDFNEITITNTSTIINTISADVGEIVADSLDFTVNILGGTGITTVVENGNVLTINGSDYTLDTDITPTLAGNLNVNNFNILNAGIINSNIFNGSLTGNVNGNVEGNLKGSVFGNDSTLLVDGETSVLRGTHIGNLVGNVQGLVQGNVNGNVTGIHYGPVFGDVTGTINGPVFGDVTGTLSGQVFGDVIGNVTGLVNNIDVRTLLNTFNTFDFGVLNGDSFNPFQWLLTSIVVDMGTFTTPNSLGIDCGSFL